MWCNQKCTIGFNGFTKVCGRKVPFFPHIIIFSAILTQEWFKFSSWFQHKYNMYLSIQVPWYIASSEHECHIMPFGAHCGCYSLHTPFSICVTLQSELFPGCWHETSAHDLSPPICRCTLESSYIDKVLHWKMKGTKVPNPRHSSACGVYLRVD